MKTFFGMTAAALLVVTMPQEGLAVPIAGEKCIIGIDHPVPVTMSRPELCCIDNKTIGICTTKNFVCIRDNRQTTLAIWIIAGNQQTPDTGIRKCKGDCVCRDYGEKVECVQEGVLAAVMSKSDALKDSCRCEKCSECRKPCKPSPSAPDDLN